MPNTIDITLPDIGDFDEVEVIEVLVEEGQNIEAEQSIITLESDKASMEIPSPQSGIVKTLHIALGDKINTGWVLITLETSSEKIADETQNISQNDPPTNASTQETTITVPDIGDFDEVEVIEVLVEEGQNIEAEQSIITLESDKASMEIPSPQAGQVVSLNVAVGDKIKQDDDILTLTTLTIETKQDKPQKAQATPTTKTNQQTSSTKTNQQTPTTKTNQQTPTTKTNQTPVNVTPQANYHASPAMRKLARELGVDLSRISGSGNNGRITEIDIKGFVKQAMQNGSSSAIPAIPLVDFSQFGEIEKVDLSRINKLSGKHLHACWLNVPHVSQFDEVDISDLEEFRQAQKQKGIKLTPLVFIMKAVAIALGNNPRFNASLSEDKQSLITKKYINLGIAVDTPNGLMVPIVRDVNHKNITQLSTDLADISSRAREGKLSSADLSGGSFTISSLGGIGGTQFTPIVNAPEVAILGVSRSRMQPIWSGSEFEPKLMLPLVLSYDHRVIDGAQGVRFITELNTLLGDIRNLI